MRTTLPGKQPRDIGPPAHPALLPLAYTALPNRPRHAHQDAAEVAPLARRATTPLTVKLSPVNTRTDPTDWSSQCRPRPMTSPARPTCPPCPCPCPCPRPST